MKIAIVSPSAPSTHSKERNYQFEQGLHTLEALDFTCAPMPHAHDKLSYIASSTANRLQDLHRAYADSSVDIVIAANGGWNCSHLLQGLDYDLIKKSAKPLVGASDITALQNAIYAKTGQPQLYGPMVTWGFHTNDHATNQSFLAMAKDGRQEISLQDFGRWLKPGQLNGTLVGGNLVSISSLLGTPYEPDWHNRIFVWEDTSEAIYRLDRALTHFKNAGVWDKIAGMVIGHLDNIDEVFGDTRTNAMAMVADHFADYDFPILKTGLFGHNIPTQITLPIGGRMSTDAQRVITTLQP